jgi:hypothetical protein
VGQQPLPLASLPKLLVLGLCWGDEQASTACVDLPASLTRLSVAGKVQAAAVPAGVRQLTITDPVMCPGIVQALPAMRSLQALKLCFTRRSPPDVESLLPTVSVLKGLTGLTCVRFRNGFEQVPASTFRDVELGRALAQLTGLHELKCRCVQFDASGALHLSVLTQLTKLKMAESRSGINGLVVCSLGLCLTNLQALDVTFCGVQTQAVIPVLARLPQLRQLSMTGNEVVVDDVGFMRFSDSASLTSIGLDLDTHDISDEALDRFRQVMPHVKLEFD